MAGSGKTSLMRQVTSYLVSQSLPAYVVNLNPAAMEVPYDVNIDIRDTVNYKQVMQQYKLGPNGAIVTALNLFATRFDQVVTFLEQRQGQVDYVFVDTPGQIEVFTWSASGQIITEALSSTFPTCVLYVVDTARCCTSTATFMANMTYACSLLYKAQLPFLLVFSKCDVASPELAVRWMADAGAFADALAADTSYSAALSRSLSLMLDEFYHSLQHVAFSAVTGQGCRELFQAVQRCRAEYTEVFYPALQARQAQVLATRQAAQARSLAQFAADGDHPPPSKSRSLRH